MDEIRKVLRDHFNLRDNEAEDEKRSEVPVHEGTHDPNTCNCDVCKAIRGSEATE